MHSRVQTEQRGSNAPHTTHIHPQPWHVHCYEMTRHNLRLLACRVSVRGLLRLQHPGAGHRPAWCCLAITHARTTAADQRTASPPMLNYFFNIGRHSFGALVKAGSLRHTRRTGTAAASSSGNTTGLWPRALIQTQTPTMSATRRRA